MSQQSGKISQVLGAVIDVNFPDGKRQHRDQVDWDQRFFDWESGRNLDEGRTALNLVLAELRKKQSRA